MSADLVDPFAPAKKLQQSTYDGWREEVRDPVLFDKAFLPEVFWFMFESLGARALNGHDSDGFAARVLELVALRAKDGIPMNERGEVL